VLKELLAHGERVRVLALPNTVDDLPRSKMLEVVSGGLDDAAALARAVQGVVRIYHFAGMLPGSSESDLQRVNVKGTKNLLAACVDEHQLRRIVFASSTAVYGAGVLAGPITEDSPRRPAGIAEIKNYGESKRAAEDLVVDFHRKKGCEFVIVRPSVVYAPRIKFIERLVRDVYRQPMLAIRNAIFYGDMQWAHITDATDAFLAAGRVARAANQAFIIAGAEHTTTVDLAEAIAQALQWPRLLVPPGARRLRSGPLKYDIDKARRLLGYTPKVRLRDGMPDVLKAMQLEATTRFATSL
jgi:nucleoside-diphosphate-sugar epimerase